MYEIKLSNNQSYFLNVNNNIGEKTSQYINNIMVLLKLLDYNIDINITKNFKYDLMLTFKNKENELKIKIDQKDLRFINLTYYLKKIETNKVYNNQVNNISEIPSLLKEIFNFFQQN